jgi:ketosteroid isomerase-like protein
VRLARAIVALAALACAFASPARAEDSADQAAIRTALLQWTEDFNAHRADKVCDLFEKDVIADIRDAQGEQTFDKICERLKRAVGNETRSYSYASDIKEILVFGDVAVVRLVWTLTISGGPEGDVKSAETGVDLFRRQPDGTWKIMRWMSYD